MERCSVQIHKYSWCSAVALNCHLAGNVKLSHFHKSLFCTAASKHQEKEYMMKLLIKNSQQHPTISGSLQYVWLSARLTIPVFSTKSFTMPISSLGISGNQRVFASTAKYNLSPQH